MSSRSRVLRASLRVSVKDPPRSQDRALLHTSALAICYGEQERHATVQPPRDPPTSMARDSCQTRIIRGSEQARCLTDARLCHRTRKDAPCGLAILFSAQCQRARRKHTAPLQGEQMPGAIQRASEPCFDPLDHLSRLSPCQRAHPGRASGRRAWSLPTRLVEKPATWFAVTTAMSRATTRRSAPARPHCSTACCRLSTWCMRNRKATLSTSTSLTCMHTRHTWQSLTPGSS